MTINDDNKMGNDNSTLCVVVTKLHTCTMHEEQLFIQKI